jgi:hypothetical protein
MLPPPLRVHRPPVGFRCLSACVRAPLHVVMGSTSSPQAVLCGVRNAPRPPLPPLSLSELTVVENLEPLHGLTALNLSSNRLVDVHGLTALSRLVDLDLQGNSLVWGSLPPLAQLPHLRRLWLAGNPLCADPDYRARLLRLCPQVATLDGEPLQAPPTSAPEAPPGRPWAAVPHSGGGPPGVPRLPPDPTGDRHRAVEPPVAAAPVAPTALTFPSFPNPRSRTAGAGSDAFGSGAFADGHGVVFGAGSSHGQGPSPRPDARSQQLLLTSQLLSLQEVRTPQRPCPLPRCHRCRRLPRPPDSCSFPFPLWHAVACVFVVCVGAGGGVCSLLLPEFVNGCGGRVAFVWVVGFWLRLLWAAPWVAHACAPALMCCPRGIAGGVAPQIVRHQEGVIASLSHPAAADSHKALATETVLRGWRAKLMEAMVAGHLKEAAAARQAALWSSAAESLGSLAAALDTMGTFVRGRLGALESRLHLASGRVGEAVTLLRHRDRLWRTARRALEDEKRVWRAGLELEALRVRHEAGGAVAAYGCRGVAEDYGVGEAEVILRSQAIAAAQDLSDVSSRVCRRVCFLRIRVCVSV